LTETIIKPVLFTPPSVHHWRKAGEVIVFDDTYPHSAWNDSDSERIILYIDFKVPEVRRRCLYHSPHIVCARLVVFGTKASLTSGLVCVGVALPLNWVLVQEVVPRLPPLNLSEFASESDSEDEEENQKLQQWLNLVYARIPCCADAE
jgi:hypothetical protein